jgi:hypothetical protein
MRTTLTRQAILRVLSAAASVTQLPAFASEETPDLAVLNTGPFADAMQPDVAGVTVIRQPGWSVEIPSSYYRPKSRAKAGTFDDTVFVAADYPAGKTASVTVVDCATLLIDSGDPLPLQAGEIKSLRDLGKPSKLAALLAGRRDNDPMGVQPSRSEVRDAERLDGNDELTFTVLTQRSSATSLTTAQAGVRRTVARCLFIPGGDRGGYLLTAWATSDAPDATCVTIPCPECRGLRCDCPPPKCDPGGAPPSAQDLAIVRSLRIGAAGIA